MYWKFVLIVLLSFTARTYCQPLPIPHGTLIVAIVCTDGILIASDSRASWKDDNKILFAYADGFKKVFQIGKFQMATSGVSTFGGIYLNEIVDSFNRNVNADSTLLSTFDNFKTFLMDKFNIKDTELANNKFILAGYENNRPVVIGFESSGQLVESQVLTSESIVNPYWRIPIPNPYTCLETRNILETLYQKCSSIDQSIGGPIYFLQIRQGNVATEMKKVIFKHFERETDFIEAILNEKTEVVYVYPESKEVLRGVLLRRLKSLTK